MERLHWLCMIAVNIRVIMMENTDIIATAMDVIGMQQTTTVDIQEEVHPVAEAVRLCF